MAEDKSLLEYRMQKLEEEYAGVRTEIKEVKEAVFRLEKRFAGMPEGGMNCQTHARLMEEMQQKISDHHAILDDLQRFRWKSVGVIGVCLLIVQLIGGTIIDRAMTKEPVQPVRIELVVPSALTNQTIK